MFCQTMWGFPMNKTHYPGSWCRSYVPWQVKGEEKNDMYSTFPETVTPENGRLAFWEGLFLSETMSVSGSCNCN